MNSNLAFLVVPIFILVMLFFVHYLLRRANREDVYTSGQSKAFSPLAQ